jgi:hypothetical protein
LCNSHEDVLVDDHRANGANPGSESNDVQADAITRLEDSQNTGSSTIAWQQGEHATEHTTDHVGTLDPGVSASDWMPLHRPGSVSDPVLSSSAGIKFVAVSSLSAMCLPLVPDPASALDLGTVSSVAGGSDGYSAPRDTGSVAEHLESPDESSSMPVVLVTTQWRTRLQSNIVKPKIFTDGTMQYDCRGIMASHEPNNLDEALGDENWKGAMDDEFLPLIKN